MAKKDSSQKSNLSKMNSNKNQIMIALENIIANMPGHVYWKDKNGVYQGCNDSQANSLGFKYGHEIIGKTDFELPWGENIATKFRENDKHIMQTGKTLIIEEQSIVDGKNSTVLSHKSPMKDENGEITGVLGISINITVQKKIESDLKSAKEAAEAANKAKTEFLENMRHDIRTPLSGIIGFAELIKSEAPNHNLTEYAENLTASSYALLDLMNEVLEAIRVNSGEIAIVKRKFSLKDTLQHVINLNKAKACSKRLDLQFNYDKNLPKYLLGDNIRIHRIANELIANALNFTDVGNATLTAALAKVNDSKIILKLTVQDTGIGIIPDKQEEIFYQFKRLTPSYKGIYKGAGLGLAIIKQFIDDLQAEIYVNSTPRKGSTFTCIIPLQVSLLDDNEGVDNTFVSQNDIPSTNVLQHKEYAKKNTSKSVYNHNILVVEDNSIAQKIAQSLLKQMDCHVDLAENGHKGLELWKNNQYDLIFMDIGLPDIDGYEVTHHIRIQELTNKNHIPIIALTAHTGEDNKQRCIEAGMNAVLTKPLTIKKCNDILGSFIASTKKESAQSPNPYKDDLPETKEELFDLTKFPLLDIEDGIKTTGSKEMLNQMLKLMLSDSLKNDVAKMIVAHDNKDWENTQKIAHKIKGGLVYVGTIRAKMACQYFERYWKIGEIDLLEELYQQAITTIDDTTAYIHNYFRNSSK